MNLKRLLFLLVSVGGVLALAFFWGGAGTALEQDVTIYIATDMHYLSPSLDSEESYFSTPLSGGDGKVVHYSDELTRAFLAQVIEEQPDVLIMSGDLTLNGAAQSHNEMAALLEQVQASGVQVLAMAGNHDVDGTAADYSTFDGETVEVFPSLTSDEYKVLYAPFGWDQAISRDESSVSYIYEPAPGLWIVMLDANCYGKGFVKDGTLAWLETQLQQARRKGITVLGVSHQNLYAHSSLLSFGYQIYNAAEVQALYEKYGVEANFSGHIHIQSILEDTVPEAATSSLAVTGTQFGQIDCGPEGITYTARRTDVEGWAADNGSTDENLRTFAEYATWYFEEVGRKQVRENHADSGLSQSEIELLAETFAKINAAYFSGQPISEADFAEGLALWRRQEGGFSLTYIESMLAGSARDNLYIKIK